VIDGDTHDLRFLDDQEYEELHGHKKKKGLIVGLKYKRVTGYPEPPDMYGQDGFIVSTPAQSIKAD
jgi:hypothetical protein